jgi:hypothetical protein
LLWTDGSPTLIWNIWNLPGDSHGPWWQFNKKIHGNFQGCRDVKIWDSRKASSFLWQLC